MEMLSLNYFILIALLISPTLQHALPYHSNEEYHEELYVHPLSSGNVNTYFQFTSRWHYGEKNNLHNTQLITRSVAEILLQFDVKELHISLTQGLWRYETWGYPVIDAAPGAEVWAWFAAPNLTEAQVDDQWIKLANTLSGILCASLNFIDKTNSIEPKLGFRPQFIADSKINMPHYVRYASLPREIVCTENLTPWKKLLPCNSKYGFASLLNSGHVHNTNYHSLGIKVRTICKTYDNNCILELTESANLVHDPIILGSQDFSLRRLFGQGLNGHCALAKSSKIYVDLNEDRFVLTPEPTYNIISQRGGSMTLYGVYDIKNITDEQFFNIAWVKRNTQDIIEIINAPPLIAHRYTLGHGQERGKIITQIRNNHYTTIPIVYQENIPWFVPSYMHTLKADVITSEKHSNKSLELLNLHYIPGVQRARPCHLEFGLQLPPNSLVEISFDFDYTFLKWLEYPPDANHGHYIGAAVLTALLPIGRNYTAIPVEGLLFADSFNASRPSYFLQVRTETIILSLPTPDFSMPYNVICLACTVVALAFGPIHSVATKRMVIEQKDTPSVTMWRSLLNKIFKRKQKTANITDATADAAQQKQVEEEEIYTENNMRNEHEEDD